MLCLLLTRMSSRFAVPPGVDVNVFFDFVLRLSHANCGGFVEDDFNAMQGFF